MDVLPGDDPAMPDGCTAGYYVGPKRGSNGKPKWSPHPAPASKVCAQPHFVPMGCHKCWCWNYKTNPGATRRTLTLALARTRTRTLARTLARTPALTLP